ncbi:MAG TPA: diacylglycerol kinase family protein [Kofleriaceae bacterium]|nr:diacylglycerol kinase family protein [Kofleriaceae bacterium]
MRAAVVFNPVAGGPSSPPLEELTGRLAGRFELDVLVTSPERDADACAREALARGAELVIAAGGDGTVSAVAGELIGSEAILGVVPCGTANAMARALGVAGDLDEACAALASAEPRWLDTATCDGRSMLLFCSVGLHAETMDDASREQKGRWGVLAYLAAGLRNLLELDPFEVELETESHRIRCRATSVMVANLAPPRSILAQGPAVVRPDDGLLDVTLVAADDLASAVASGLHLLRTASRNEPAERDRIGFFPCRRVRITTAEPQKVSVDGEVTGTTPVEVACRPRSLRVLVPQGALDDAGPPDARLSGLPDLEVERT